jgi:DNA invertase Pin-like site-specific DNA recombinase
MLLSYARVSINDQSLDLQRAALEAAGCERTFEDMAGSAKADSIGLATMMTVLRADDTVVWRLNRLGCLLKNLIELVGRLEAARVRLCRLQDTSAPLPAAGAWYFTCSAPMPSSSATWSAGAP